MRGAYNRGNAMSYLVEISGFGLDAARSRDIGKDFASLEYLSPVFDEKARRIPTLRESQFNWDEKKVRADLRALQAMGYRGWIEFFDSSQHEGTKYALTDDGVELRNASLIYPELPDEMVRSKEGEQVCL